MSDEKPFSEACLRNREPILQILKPLLADRRAVLEIGSGTGQHAVYFASALPQLIWQTSDRADYHAGIQAWLDEAALPNLRAPVRLDVLEPWPALAVDAAYSANTAHIMSWPAVVAMFRGLGLLLPPKAPFVLYGPFMADGVHTSPSNAEFDASLRARDPAMGIREQEAIVALARANGFELAAWHPMPANNRSLVFRKI